MAFEIGNFDFDDCFNEEPFTMMPDRADYSDNFLWSTEEEHEMLHGVACWMEMEATYEEGSGLQNPIMEDAHWGDILNLPETDFIQVSDKELEVLSEDLEKFNLSSCTFPPLLSDFECHLDHTDAQSWTSDDASGTTLGGDEATSVCDSLSWGSLLEEFSRWHEAGYGLDTRRKNKLLCALERKSIEQFIQFNNTQLWRLDIVFGRAFRDFVCRQMNLPIPETKYKNRKRPVRDEKKLIDKRAHGTVMKRSQPATQVKLVTFLLDCLNEKLYEDVIQWSDRKLLVFKIIDSKALAHLWCVLKDNDVVSYDHLTRSIRMARKKHLFLDPPKKQNKVYRLAPTVFNDWEKSHRYS